MVVRTTTAHEQELTGRLVGGLQIVIDGLAGLFTQFKFDRSPGFALSDRCPIRRVPAGSDIFDPEPDDVTAAKFAVDRQIEHSEVVSALLDLEFCPNRPDVFGSQRRLGPSQLSLIPWDSLGRGDRIHLILHSHTPRLGYRGEKHEPPG
jgi:hypothetical protein